MEMEHVSLRSRFFSFFFLDFTCLCIVWELGLSAVTNKKHLSMSTSLVSDLCLIVVGVIETWLSIVLFFPVMRLLSCWSQATWRAVLSNWRESTCPSTTYWPGSVSTTISLVHTPARSYGHLPFVLIKRLLFLFFVSLAMLNLQLVFWCNKPHICSVQERLTINWIIIILWDHSEYCWVAFVSFSFASLCSISCGEDRLLCLHVQQVYPGSPCVSAGQNCE